jgi:hypothetical protein
LLYVNPQDGKTLRKEPFSAHFSQTPPNSRYNHSLSSVSTRYVTSTTVLFSIFAYQDIFSPYAVYVPAVVNVWTVYPPEEVTVPPVPR